jgi:adenylate cyclase
MRHVTHALDFGQDPGVICKAFGAVVLWLLGFPDQARGQSQQAIQMSHELSPTSQAVALFFAAMVHQLRNEPSETQDCAERCGAIATEHGLSFWVAGSSVFRGWALTQQGAVDVGIATVQQGLVDWQKTGSVTYRTYFLGMLAELLIGKGELAEGTRLLDEAIALADETDERFYEPELYRLRGEALFAGASESDHAARSEADRCFRHALDLAQRRSAQSLERRAEKSISHQVPPS